VTTCSANGIARRRHQAIFTLNGRNEPPMNHDHATRATEKMTTWQMQLPWWSATVFYY
jgi:hypothetical protein